MFAFFTPREVPPIADLGRDAQVGLLDAAEHFLVQGVDQRLMLAHKGLGVFVLSREVIDDRRILFLVAVTHPRIVIRDLVTMDLQYLWLFLCDRWFHILCNDHELADHDDDE